MVTPPPNAVYASRQQTADSSFAFGGVLTVATLGQYIREQNKQAYA
jgi:hypothetical protein